MVQIRRTLITIVSLAALGGLAALAAWDWRAIAAAEAINARIIAGKATADASVPEEAFAAGLRFSRAGKVPAALAQYNRVENEEAASPALRRAARFNGGNLYLRNAIEAADAGDTAAATPQFELAKAAYRVVLRADPQHMSARYNLERALRRAPEAEQQNDAELEQLPPAERSVTTMQVESQGLP
jgi:mxaK protein